MLTHHIKTQSRPHPTHTTISYTITSASVASEQLAAAAAAASSQKVIKIKKTRRFNRKCLREKGPASSSVSTADSLASSELPAKVSKGHSVKERMKKILMSSGGQQSASTTHQSTDPKAQQMTTPETPNKNNHGSNHTSSSSENLLPKSSEKNSPGDSQTQSQQRTTTTTMKRAIFMMKRSSSMCSKSEASQHQHQHHQQQQSISIENQYFNEADAKQQQHYGTYDHTPQQQQPSHIISKQTIIRFDLNNHDDEDDKSDKDKDTLTQDNQQQHQSTTSTTNRGRGAFINWKQWSAEDAVTISTSGGVWRPAATASQRIFGHRRCRSDQETKEHHV